MTIEKDIVRDEQGRIARIIEHTAPPPRRLVPFEALVEDTTRTVEVMLLARPDLFGGPIRVRIGPLASWVDARTFAMEVKQRLEAGALVGKADRWSSLELVVLPGRN